MNLLFSVVVSKSGHEINTSEINHDASKLDNAFSKKKSWEILRKLLQLLDRAAVSKFLKQYITKQSDSQVAKVLFTVLL